jgi:hypothetical protein
MNARPQRAVGKQLHEDDSRNFCDMCVIHDLSTQQEAEGPFVPDRYEDYPVRLDREIGTMSIKVLLREFDGKVDGDARIVGVRDVKRRYENAPFEIARISTWLSLVTAIIGSLVSALSVDLQIAPTA